MTKSTKKILRAWFPGRVATTDRLGDSLESPVPAREFAPARPNLHDIAVRARWSVGVV